jgi:hypothetical protein
MGITNNHQRYGYFLLVEGLHLQVFWTTRREREMVWTTLSILLS